MLLEIIQCVGLWFFWCETFLAKVAVEFRTKVRPWKELAPAFTSLDNAYRPRKGEEDRVPHSFVFKRRDSSSTQLRISFVFAKFLFHPTMIGKLCPGNLILNIFLLQDCLRTLSCHSGCHVDITEAPLTCLLWSGITCAILSFHRIRSWFYQEMRSYKSTSSGRVPQCIQVFWLKLMIKGKKISWNLQQLLVYILSLHGLLNTTNHWPAKHIVPDMRLHHSGSFWLALCGSKDLW